MSDDLQEGLAESDGTIEDMAVLAEREVIAAPRAGQPCYFPQFKFLECVIRITRGNAVDCF